MQILFLTLLLTAKPIGDHYADELFAVVNEYRVAEDVPPCFWSDTLAKAAGIEAEWTVYALRHDVDHLELHNTYTPWLRKNYPDLLWERLEATFPDGIPDQISAFNVARLCGYGNLCRDNIGIANRDPLNAVIGWARSTDGHRENLLDPQWTELGTAKRGGGQSAICVAVFGNRSQE